MRKTVLVALLAALVVTPALALAGCQACVADSSQPDQPAARPGPGGTGIAARPRLMSPAAHLVLRDAGAGDE